MFDFLFGKSQDENHATLIPFEGTKTEYMNDIDDEIRALPNKDLIEENQEWGENQITWDEDFPELEITEQPYHPAVVSEFIVRSNSGL